MKNKFNLTASLGSKITQINYNIANYDFQLSVIMVELKIIFTDLANAYTTFVPTTNNGTTVADFTKYDDFFVTWLEIKLLNVFKKTLLIAAPLTLNIPIILITF